MIGREISTRKNTKKREEFGSEAGISILEYIIALVLVMIAFVTWLELTATAVKKGTFVKRLGDVEALASSKAADLAKQADELVKKIPKNQGKAGSVAPSKPVGGYFELLDESGQVIPDTSKALSKFERQWLIIKDLPGKNEVTVYVSVLYKERNRTSIFRLTKAVKTDGMTVRKN